MLHPALPTHPLGQGGPFSVVLGPALAELARWLGNAAHLLGNLAPEASPILTWPHHFDIARLLPSGTLEDGSPRTVGVGLSPGDEHYGEPYFYVAPWPVPEVSELPPLPRGEWQTEAFFAAVLTATELLRETGDEQEETARGFCEAAISASRRLLAA